MPASLFNLGRYVRKNTDEPGYAPPVAPFTPPLSKDASVPTFSTSSPTASVQPPVAKEPIPTNKSTDGQEPATTLNPQETAFQKRAGMDILSRLTQRSNKTLMAGVAKAKELGNQFIDSEEVLWGLMQDASIYQLVSEFKVVPTELVQQIEASFKKGDYTDRPKFSPRVKKVLELSLAIARNLGYEFISPEHILLGLLEEGEGLAAQLLAKVGITYDKLKSKITGKKEQEKQEEKSAVSQFATDLTALAAEGKLDPVVARSAEIERIMHILSRRTKNNPLLIGDAGVGKTAIVEGLAQRIIEGKVPETLLNKHILSLDLMNLVAGASHRGEFEERFKKLLNEIKGSQGQYILFIDEIHTMVGAGGSEGSMDASNILKPSLARGELQTIGSTTVAEYRKYIEKDRALERRFQPVLIKEPNQDEAIEMLQSLKDKYEAFHKVSINDAAIEAAVRLSSRYIGDRFLPDKAVDLIDEAASSVRLPAISLPEEMRTLESKLTKTKAEKDEAEKLHDQVKPAVLKRQIKELEKTLADKQKAYELKKGMTTGTVTPDAIQDIVSAWTGIPISRMTESESDKLVDLENIIHRRLINQEAAVGAVAEAVRRGRSGLSSAKRPIGSFIFMGPTGVGKTELAKALAEVLFGSEDMMIRIDMSEYMEKHEVAKLIGAPPGYVGYDEGGQLTEAVRRKPYSVVLLDEIEKAHPDVFNILLQILDDGRLTDNKGRTISFKNTILICTSNIATGIIQNALLTNMKVGNGDRYPQNAVMATEETGINTYVVTPTGREIVTKKNSYWEKNPTDTAGSMAAVWKKGTLSDYFGGQVVTGNDLFDPRQKFPMEELNTHAMLPSGEEIISAKNRLWRRKSTIAKEWESLNLIDYVANHTVENATPDKPDEQLPTAYWDTHAVSPQEKEIIGVGHRLWMRDNRVSTTWKTMTVADYLKQSAQSSTPPADMLISTHLFGPNGDEVVIAGERFWVKTAIDGWKQGVLYELLSGANAPVVKATARTKEEEEFEQKFADISDKLLDELRKFFKPELLNRFDETIVFRPLAVAHMLAIVNLQVKGLTKLLEDQDMGLTISSRAKEELAMVGFDPVYGARPLRRTTQRLIENPISTMLIKAQVVMGDVIEINFDDAKDEFTFAVRHIAPPEPKKPEVTPPAPIIDDTDAKQKEATDNTVPKPEEKMASPNQEPIQPDGKLLQTSSPVIEASPVTTDTNVGHFNDLFGDSQPTPKASSMQSTSSD